VGIRKKLLVLIDKGRRWERRSYSDIMSLFRYQRELSAFKREVTAQGSRFAWGPTHRCIRDYNTASGSASGHYFHQDLFVAHQVFLRNPQHHVDAGSRIDGLVAHIASFRELEVLDIRPQNNPVVNVKFRQADLMDLPDELYDYADSVSCLHALEHFGLGRYGDPLCYDGHLLGIKSLNCLLQPGGTLYLSVPIGPLRIEFNAHRVFSMQYMLDCLAPLFTLINYSFVDDLGGFHAGAALNDQLIQSNCGCDYGCGIFELVKRS